MWEQSSGKKKLVAEFEMKDLGMMHYFLGMEVVITYIVARLPYSIFQTQYIFQPDLLHMR